MARIAALISICSIAFASPAHAQEQAPVEQPEAAEAPEAVPEPPLAPKVAIVVAGDPDEAMRAAALRVEHAIGDALRMPIDPILRGAFVGEAGAEDDGLDEVRRERQRLGLDEARDAPVLASLGRRASASAVVVVRAAGDTPEVVVFDVRNAAFFDGALSLGADATDVRIRGFVVRRARAAARGVVPSPEQAARASAPHEQPPHEEEHHEPDFFEQYWPYMLAGVLLAGMIVAIAVTSSSNGSDQAVLRFEPGGR